MSSYKSRWESYPEDECPIYKAFKDATVHHVRDEVFWRKDHSSFPVAYTSTPIKEDSKLVGAVVTFRDITERKRAEENLARAMADLARSNAELEQLAYIASHDLQEPLRMVASFVQLLGKRYKGKLDGDADDFINYAVDGANRMQILINDLLAYSRVGRRGKEFKEVSCEIVLDQAMSNLQNLIEQSGAVVTRNPLPVAKGMTSSLCNCFRTLSVMPSNLAGTGRRTFRLRPSEGWTIGAFYVRDNGIGIESEYFERIFSIFQRLHDRRQYPGTGIGLAICKKVVGASWRQDLGGVRTGHRFNILFHTTCTKRADILTSAAVRRANRN